MRYDKWQIKSKYPADIFEEIYKRREESSGDFVIDPKYTDLSDFSSLGELKKAGKLIKQFVDNSEKIGIFMDYDADGICAGAILHKALKYIGGKPISYVPNRADGYGLNKTAIDFFVKAGVKLIVTVDCGIKNFDEVDYANSFGLKVIITDHHLIGSTAPDAFAIVHSHYKARKGTFGFYSGAGVAYQLARYLLKDGNRAKWLIDLAAISTIADVVPLVGDNRIIVSYGLIVINKTKNIGLRELIKCAKLNDREIGVYEIGYMIAPRINAPGRIASSQASFDLLTTNSKTKAKELALQLSCLNEERQTSLDTAVKNVLKRIEKENLNKNKIIVIRGEWSEGIVGLIAGKVTQKYHRPSIVLTKVDGRLKGSARSVKKVDITKIISSCEDLLISFGGHKQAAGLSLKAKNYEKFINKIMIESELISPKSLEKVLEIDALIKPEDINLRILKKIEKLHPFGVENPRPKFAIKKLKLLSMQKIGKENNHVRFKIESANMSIDCIAFDFRSGLCDIEDDGLYDIAFSMQLDKWNGREKIKLFIEDAKKH